jgi:SOS-response transcriptional repressor LexA
MTAPRPLTAAQTSVYEAIGSFQRKYGYTPSTYELAQLMGKAQTTVQNHITAIIDRGRARRIHQRHIELM